MVVQKRVGLAGMGFIGRRVYDAICARPELQLKIAFVHDRQRERLADVPPELVLEDLLTAREASPDLIVEAASADFTRGYGAELLAIADFLPLSVSALSDPAVEHALREAARKAENRLLIPHGALVGLDALAERQHEWRSVTVTFRKHPEHIEPAALGAEPTEIRDPTVVFDGSVREAARRFPRNVNAMVTAGLATVGLDRCRAVLVADPGLTEAIAEVRAEAIDGGVVETVKRGPMVGVSGTEMADALLQSIVTATGRRGAVQFV